jgi:hypothetical protein
MTMISFDFAVSEPNPSHPAGLVRLPPDETKAKDVTA